MSDRLTDDDIAAIVEAEGYGAWWHSPRVALSLAREVQQLRRELADALDDAIDFVSEDGEVIASVRGGVATLLHQIALREWFERTLDGIARAEPPA